LADEISRNAAPGEVSAPRSPGRRRGRPARSSRRGPGPGRNDPGGNGPEGSGSPEGVAGVRIVQDQQGLVELARELRKAGVFGLDTEFIPENRLFPELCLVQVASAEVEAVVDPLAVADLTPIFDLIADSSVLKVVHSGKHDFDIFHGLAGVVPKNVFDTQIAAAVIGHGKRVQIALSALVAGFVGRELSKNEQMSDWLQRPLKPRQVEYAIADVRYLLRLREKLVERARALSRLDWMEQEMAPLTEASSYGLAPENECYRNLDMPGLTPSQRGSLRTLAAWRERRARRSNRPRPWVLRDAVLRDLARRQPKTRDAMLLPYQEGGRRSGKIDPKTIQHARSVISRNHEDLLREIAKGRANPVQFTGPGKVERRAAPESLALLLETWLKLRAAEHGVAPELLATSEELRVIAATYPNPPSDIRPLRGFRRRILGEDLLLILSGKAVIQVDARQDEPGALPPIRLTRPGRLGRFFLRDSRPAASS